MFLFWTPKKGCFYFLDIFEKTNLFISLLSSLVSKDIAIPRLQIASTSLLSLLCFSSVLFCGAKQI